jgi:NADH-quinone oxidoreductase subunit J
LNGLRRLISKELALREASFDYGFQRTKPSAQDENGEIMTAQQIIFIIVGLATLGSALMVVTSRNILHAALWLVSTLFGVAVIYTLLNAGFLAVVQVVVYIGAIAILFIFAVMLTRKDMRDQGPQLNRNWWLGALLAALTFSGLFYLLQSWSGFSKSAADLPPGFDAVGQLGDALVSPDAFVLPFEVASVLLVAALVGAVYLAFNRK